MMPWRRVSSAIGALAVVLAGPALPSCAVAQEAVDSAKRPVELHLGESFYRALRAEGGKTYTTSLSDEYLRQIAVSTRFVVETNLRIVEQQARIIELLESRRGEKTR
jgi:hypothetical protein